MSDTEFLNELESIVLANDDEDGQFVGEYDSFVMQYGFFLNVSCR